jgi:hypothetical protein
MTHTAIKVQVDIYKLPEVCHVAKENIKVTIGDLHGNAMKLMFMLVKQGIATNVTKANYDKLAEIYLKQTHTLTKDDIKEFNSIISAIKFNKAAISLIGDELGDRGNNDYFTLKILEQLQAQQVPLEIIISNHSIEFLQACEKHKETNNFHAPMLILTHADSLEKLNILVEKNIVSAEEVLNIAQKAYKPYLKAISYSLNKDNSEITIYSHAGIGINIIKGLAKQFAVNYRDSTAVELANTINRINRKFQKHVQDGTVHTLCPYKEMYAGYSGDADLTKTPFVCTLWNRRYDLIDRPINQNGYNLVYVHGHDPQDPDQTKKHVHNLDADNSLGKSAYFNKGTYVVLMTDYYSKVLDEKPEEDILDEQNDEVEQEPLVKVTTISLGELKQSFEEQLQKIKLKEGILRNKGHSEAAEAAKILHDKISTSYRTTLPINVDQFKKECKKAIAESRSELESHREWKLVLSYLALTITGLGVLVILADVGYKLATGKHFFFFQTDTAERVSDLEETIDQVPESPKTVI